MSVYASRQVVLWPFVPARICSITGVASFGPFDVSCVCSTTGRKEWSTPFVFSVELFRYVCVTGENVSFYRGCPVDPEC